MMVNLAEYDDEKLLTYEEVAEFLHIGISTVTRYRKEGKLKVIYLFPKYKRSPRIKVSDLKEFLQTLEDPRQDV